MTLFKGKCLGRGAFGVVYKGQYLKQTCAIKILHSLDLQLSIEGLSAGDVDQEEAQRAFERECKALQEFQHPNIVQYLFTSRHPKSGNLVLCLELLDSSLKHFLSNKANLPLSDAMNIQICENIASALEYIHSRDIVHRDLCADNILLKLGSSIVAKISDFGMSRIINKSTLTSTLTAMGHRMGYLPPEAPQEGTRYGSSLDIFSFGAVTTQIVSRVSYIDSVAERNYYVSTISSEHPLKPIINLCLNEDKDKRPSAVTLKARLSSLLYRYLCLWS